MKQKNAILIAVAVGCGLVAAVLTSKMFGGEPKKDDGVEVPVAAKDLPVGTKMSKDDLKTLVTYKKVSKELLPAEFSASEDQLADKRLIRTVRAGETFNPQDLTTNTPISPPANKNVMTIPVSQDKGVAGFAGPGSHVDVIATILLKGKEKAWVGPVLTDMLVLAIDTNTQGAQNGAFQNMSMVSLAVDGKEARVLQGVTSRGADIRLILRNPDKPAIWDTKPTEEELWKILGGDTDKPSESDREDERPKATGPMTVKLPVAVEEIKAGTRLTSDVIRQKFKFVEYVPPVPELFVQELKDHSGEYLQKDLQPEQFVPKAYFGETPPKPPEQPKAAPEKKPAPKPPVDPPVYFDATVTSAGGTKKYRYEVLKSGEYKFLGELKEDGSVQPTGPDAKPDAKPDDPKKEKGDIL